MESIPPKSRKPEDTPFKQQRLAALQPILTPYKVIAIFFAIGIIFVPVGVKLLNISESLYESHVKYDGYGSGGWCSISVANEGKSCEVSFTFSKDVTGPLYVYYELDNFYQNHRRYVKSRSADQLQGLSSFDSSDCDPLVSNGSLSLNPCGLIANSFFNDVITLTTSNHTLDSSGISWETDRKTKFKQVSGFLKAKAVSGKTCADTLGVSAIECKSTTYQGSTWYYYYPNDADIQYLYESYPQVISPIEGVTNEHFIVWMRTAGLAKFRKLYGKIHSNFKKGDTLNFHISNNFEVRSFDGKKSLVISTLGDFGGKNSFLGIAYIVVGSVSLLLAVLFFMKQLISPRILGDTHYLGWSP